MLVMFPLLGFLITSKDVGNEGGKILLEDVTILEKKINELTVYLKNNPKDGRAFKQLGELYVQGGRLTEAVSAYVAAEKILPKDSEIRRAFIELQAMGHATSNR